jgi:signal transduction histidine kinase
VDSSDVVAAIENALLRRRMVEEDTQYKLDELRDRIVGLLQHEFNTPLTLVLGYAELIAGTTPTNLNWDELRLSAGAILEGGKRLQTLIDSFLLLAALQNRTLDPREMHYLDAGQLWEKIAVEFADVIANGQLQLELYPCPPGVELTGDEFLIKEALRRLLETILRCHRAACRIQLGVVTLAPYVGLRLDVGGCEYCEVAAELLRPQAPTRADRLGSNAGSGMSLSVVKQIARLHGGQLHVEDKPTQGATFTLWLPAAANHGASNSPGNGPGNRAGNGAHNGAG